MSAPRVAAATAAAPSCPPRRRNRSGEAGSPLRQRHPHQVCRHRQFALEARFTGLPLERVEVGVALAGTEQPAVYAGLASRLSGFESHIRSWRRALAGGFAPLHEGLTTEIERTSNMWVWEESVIAGLLQTPEYARHVIQRYADLLAGTGGVEDAVRSRVRRQEWLYRPGRKPHVLMWEAALRSLICPPAILAAQLDRLTVRVGMDTVELGIIPFTASVKIAPANGFWVLDDRVVVAEDWHAELWLDDAANLALYRHVWTTLEQSAVYGADAQHVISAARRALTAR